MKSLFKNALLAASAVALSAGAVAEHHGEMEKDMEKTFYSFADDANTQLQIPENYREWVFVGTPLTPNELNDGAAPFPEFHAVYIDPISFKHWKETGEFRDGTMMMKELISVGSKTAVSGNGYFMGEYIGLEATIKSSELYPDEPNNWAYFSFSKPDHDGLNETATAFPTAACAACHLAAAADDMVFTQYYPVLPAAKGGE